jgi:hypothetical protein
MPTGKEATNLSVIQTKAQDLETRYSARNQMDDNLEKMVLMLWDDQPSKDGIKLTISPSARNAVMGATRLMTAASPVFSVPTEKNDEEARNKAEPIEKAAAAIWYVNGQIRQNPLEYDAVYSGILFGEIHMSVALTQDLLERARENEDKAAVKRYERIARLTPVIFEVWDPRSGYPEYDSMGLSAYYRKTKMLAGEVLDRWGQAAIDAGVNPNKRSEEVEYCDYWDYLYHVAWISGKSESLINEEHNLPCIPIVAQSIEGSYLHAKEEYRVQPHLYGVWKSGTWQRESLALTVMATNVYAIASNATFVYYANDPDKRLYVDWDTPGGTAVISNNEKLEPLVRQAVDPAMVQMYQMMEQLGEESTIFKQAMGQPLSGARSYSETALLNQAGRLPLVGSQRRGGFAMGRAMSIAFELLKFAGGKAKIQGQNGVMSIAAIDIPDSLVIDTKLDISLPQDDRSNAAMVSQLAGKYVTKEWALENLLQIGQPKEMMRDIYAEQLTEAQLQMQIQSQMQQMQMKLQQQAQAQQPQGAPPQGQPPQGYPQAGPQDQGIPPEQAALSQGQVVPPDTQGGNVPGLPMAGPQDQQQPGPADLTGAGGF